ncbi:MAG: hypothetical protein A2901_05675 [Elusimicrobia bacterium RIFCSPLOWO2_01_FULL_54_10]|nr:MAG: hypothetical protein A2901_05675 [Elusimicrobia bacterium RIFCSPLOWO2_01_FULL_54_10]
MDDLTGTVDDLGRKTHRNKIGLDVAIEALKLAVRRKHSKVTELMKYAKICRVEKIMKPYLEALL